MHSLTNGVKTWQTKLSSAGLVYLHFGQRIIAGIAGKGWFTEKNRWALGI